MTSEPHAMSAPPQSSTPEHPFRPCFDVGATCMDCGDEPRVDSYDAAEHATGWPLFDYSGCDPTVDQAAINRWLEQSTLDGKDILHIGAGNSSVARLVSGRARRVVALTVSQAEFEHARDLGLPDYSIHLMNKHGIAFPDRFESEKFDLVLDNNLTSFACCQRHAERYLATLAGLLKADGAIVTHRAGIQWTLDVGVGDVEPAWKLDEAKLRLIADAYGLHLRREEDLFFLSRALG